MTRWPMKPPKNARCDLHVGVEYDGTGAPKAIRCPNMAVETLKATVGVIAEMWCCTSCADLMVERGKAVRNPKARPVQGERDHG